MGTGFSISIILNDADISSAIEEIAHSVTQDKGNKCTTTNVVYAEEQIYQQLVESLHKKEAEFVKKNILHPETKLGWLREEEKEKIIKQLKVVYGLENINHEANYINFTIHEMQPHEQVEEISAPVLFLKKLNYEGELIKQIKEDIAKNKLEKNLVTSIYTKSFEKFEKLASALPSHTFKFNRSSEKINFFLEHQGIFLIRELVDQRILEL